MRNGNKWVALNKLCSVGLGMALLLPACAQLDGSDSWQSDLYADHALVGRIWRTSTQSFITEEELQADLNSARYLLLGEKHDNPDHHNLQLAMLQSLAAKDRLASVTFEMLDSNADQALTSLYDNRGMTGTALRDYLQWDDEGWPWQFYGPLVQETYEAGLPLLAGNISRASISAIYADSEAAPQVVLSAAALEQLHVDIDESHCGMLPESQFPAMVRVQQARDQSMAERLPLPPADKLAVLIAGNYHVRQDLGVPNYLLSAESGLTRDEIAALTFMEVQPDSESPAEYLGPAMEQSEPAYDYLWFTPAVRASDYCASFQ